MPRLMIVADLHGKPHVALERGLALAQKLGCQVHVVGFCYESLGSQGINNKKRQQQIKKKLLALRKRQVLEQVRKIKSTRLKVVTEVIWEKSIHEWIIKQCRNGNYEAVVKTGRRSESFAYTSTDWQLLRECVAPVMIVAEKRWRNTRPILAAVDLGSKSRVKQQLNKQVIATAQVYAQAMECELYVLNAIHLSPLLTELDLIDEFTHTQEIKQELQKVVKRLSSQYDIPEKHFRLKQGPVEKVITSEAARLKAQLVVMGTVARSGVSARLIGNTAEKVLSHLRTDVLALKLKR